MTVAVLSDKHKRTIYDTYGEKGLETEGLEVSEVVCLFVTLSSYRYKLVVVVVWRLVNQCVCL